MDDADCLNPGARTLRSNVVFNWPLNFELETGNWQLFLPGLPYLPFNFSTSAITRSKLPLHNFAICCSL
jgi:hypothetical protein